MKTSTALPPAPLTLANETLRAVFLPARGAKLAQLEDRRSGRQWLLPSQRHDAGYPSCRYGDDFTCSDTSGLDECFPNVAPGRHRGVSWPDHGELWSRPWSCTVHGDRMEASVQGQAWPYRFGRRASLAGASLRFDYEVVNEAGVALDCLWSLHPLLNVAPGMHLNLPGEVREVLVASSNVAGVEVGDCLPWPYIRPGESLACVKEPSRGWALKLFTDALREGCCELRAGREMLRVEWDVEAAPYLGLWLCYGGWPNAPDAGHYTLAIEPCSGRPDGLADADRRGECWTLAPGRTRRWWVRLTCTS